MISFIIPTYNEETTIATTIQNLKKNFTLVPFEVIVTDDNSSDKTVELAKKYADSVIVNINISRRRIGSNRNKGANMAKYPFLVFLDSGVEIPEPNDFFKIALEDFSTRSIAAIGVRVHIDSRFRTKTDTIFCWLLDQWFTFNNNVLGWGLATGKFQMIRTAMFKEIGGYNETIAVGEDNELFTRLGRKWGTFWDGRLTVFHAGRREHAFGWPRLVSKWMINAIWVIIFKRSKGQEWEAIR